MDIRFLTGYRGRDTNEPGLVMKDDGTVWLVNPDGTRAQLLGSGGGLAMPDVDYVVLEFEETPGAGTYTASVSLPAGALIVSEAYVTKAAWDADTAEMDTGVTSNPEAIESNVSVKQASEEDIHNNDYTVPYVADGEAEFVARIDTTGAGGSTGRTSVFVGYTTPAEVTATKTS